MRHTREEVIKRTIAEFERLDRLVDNLTDADWQRLLTRPETKEPWTVKDALAARPAAPEAWFSARERRPEWPFDLDGHSSCHRVNNIEQAL